MPEFNLVPLVRCLRAVVGSVTTFRHFGAICFRLSDGHPETPVFIMLVAVSCLLSPARVARIRTTRTNDQIVVVVAGRLTAADMRRLEYACSQALTSRLPCLEIDLRHVTHTDSTAAAVLQRLAARGASIRSRTTGGM